jgi:hypothetical protein
VQISRWLDGEATPDEARQLQGHLDSCVSCRRLAEELRRNESLVESAFGPESFGQQVAGNVAATLRRRAFLLTWGGRVAAAAALVAILAWDRSGRNAQLRAFEEQIRVAERTAGAMEAAVAASSRPPQVVTDMVYVPYPVFVPEGSATREPIPGGSGSHVSADPPREPAPDPRRGTIAMDRVDAYADPESGAVSLSWSMNRAPGNLYCVYRRVAGTVDFGEPVNASPLVEPRFIDVTARGLTTYEYRIVALARGLPVVSNSMARLTTPPDLQIEFKGSGQIGDKTGSIFEVQSRRGGRWERASFCVQPGNEIGEKVRDIDFATGIRLESVGEERQPYTINPGRPDEQRLTRPVLRSRLSTRRGALYLWAGESAVGSRERLEVASPR